MVKKVKEIWKDIYFFDFIKNELVDYRGIYQVSNEGRVKSLKRVDFSGHKLKEKIIKLKTNEGYKTVALCKNGKVRNFNVHRAPFSSFISKLLKIKIAPREEIFTIIYIDKHVRAFLNISSGLELSSTVEITCINASSTSLSS